MSGATPGDDRGRKLAELARWVEAERSMADLIVEERLLERVAAEITRLRFDAPALAAPAETEAERLAERANDGIDEYRRGYEDGAAAFDHTVSLPGITREAVIEAVTDAVARAGSRGDGGRPVAIRVADRLGLTEAARLTADHDPPPELWWHPDHSVLMPTVVEGVDYGWYALESNTWLDARPDGAVRLAAIPPAPAGEADWIGLDLYGVAGLLDAHADDTERDGDRRHLGAMAAACRRMADLAADPPHGVAATRPALAGPQAETSGETATTP